MHDILPGDDQRFLPVDGGVKVVAMVLMSSIVLFIALGIWIVHRLF